MNKISIKEVNADQATLGKHEFSGWIKTHRQSKSVSFIELTDGTSIKGLQIVIEPNLSGYSDISAKLTTGASIKVSGELVSSPAAGQKYEFKAEQLELLGEADAETYPLQKKGHSMEFLREILHLRPRSNTFGAVMRVRSVAAFAVHEFFQKNGFYYVHTPVITSSDCEGAGEMFRVTTLDLKNPPKKENGAINYDEDFFKAESFLTVSGQLEGEFSACALGKIYTFGPTFRAENSNTSRHLAEFWMIEPEMAFYELKDNMGLAEKFIKYTINAILERCPEEMEFFDKWIEKGIIASLKKVVESKFEYLDYTDAIKILEKCGKKFEFPVKWGIDMQSEHERFLTDEHIKGPVFVVNYPKEIKSFYMRVNDDGKTVRAMDLLAPRIGEIIGGSQREERHDVLVARMQELGLPKENYWWYLDLRRYGTVPHAGFGLGFERLLQYVTGMQNIRDVIPVPRFPGFSKF